MNQNGDNSQRPAQRKRTGIAHENLCGMAVEPEKAQAGADHRGAKHGQFSRARHVRDLQVSGHSFVPSEVSHRNENEGDDQCAANGQAVQAVGEINGVGAADDGCRSQ